MFHVKQYVFVHIFTTLDINIIYFLYTIMSQLLWSSLTNISAVYTLNIRINPFLTHTFIVYDSINVIINQNDVELFCIMYSSRISSFSCDSFRTIFGDILNNYFFCLTLPIFWSAAILWRKLILLFTYNKAHAHTYLYPSGYVCLTVHISERLL